MHNTQLNNNIEVRFWRHQMTKYLKIILIFTAPAKPFYCLFTLFCFKQVFISMYKTTSIALCTEETKKKLIQTGYRLINLLIYSDVLLELNENVIWGLKYKLYNPTDRFYIDYLLQYVLTQTLKKAATKVDLYQSLPKMI